MIETICPHCGNKKSFDDSYAGRTFRCPNCKGPVTIQSISEIVNKDRDLESHEISFEDELKKAEEEKIRIEEQQRKENEKNKKILIIWELIGIIVIVIGIIIGEDGAAVSGAGILICLLPVIISRLFK